MSRTKKYNKKSRTKKNNKKYRNFRKKTLSGGMDCNYKDCSYVKKLREKIKINRESIPGKSRFNRHETSIPHEKDGKILSTNGDVYTGDFVKGKSEGTGKLIIKEGPASEGEWKDDKFVAFTDWKNANKNKSNSVL